METLTIEISDRMLAFIDRQIAAGNYRDRNEYFQSLIGMEMYEENYPEPDCYIQDGKIIFANDEQRERFEQRLDEALDEFERGEVIPWKKGDCLMMGIEYLKEKRDGQQARHESRESRERGE
ncbi:MAG TPA: hypothetical protein VMR25_21685 [Planctomycetaceae bacterium]|nr:hypothetical protein [Planctomycetaceae bacterium]